MAHGSWLMADRIQKMDEERFSFEDLEVWQEAVDE